MITGLILYNALAALALLICWPFLLGSYLFGRRGKWRDRCGALPCAQGRPVWIHASSVGEVGVIAPLVAELRKRRPALDIAVSTMTETGQACAKRLFGAEAFVFFFPLDFLWSQVAALRRLDPSLVILVETELWPNLIWLCRRKNIPVVLVNARLSQRSFPQYRRFAFLFAPLLNTMRAIACQSEADAARYRALGANADIVRVFGNMKYDTIRSPVTAAEKQALRDDFGLPRESIVLTAGSTREGEETLLLDAWQEAVRNPKSKIRNPKLIIAPRHTARFAEVESILKERAIKYTTRSQQRKTSGAAEFDVLLLDSIGELVSAYAAADMAFVGGSLATVGGHNPLEPAALGVPVVFGPHMFNAQESADSLLAAGGAKQIGSTNALSEVMSEWLSDPLKRANAGKRAGQVVDDKRGAVGKTIELIESVLA